MKVFKCSWRSCGISLVRDRFTAGMNDAQIQEKILTVPDGELTIDCAFQIAEFHEAACRNVREMQMSVMQSASGVIKVQDESKYQGHQQFQKKKRSGGRLDGRQDGRLMKYCFHCGADHDPKQCGFHDKNCFCCGRKGHVRVKCHQVRWKSKVKNIGNDDSEDEVHTVMCSANEEGKTAPLLCELEVQGELVEFETVVVDAFSKWVDKVDNKAKSRSISQR
ncbi:uncharacterized protein LOC121375919 [Gigantopelta aegis]|uniref:uncharacterized protein LOC121375919 n=1 Tax=Gigantopelta aegis TaxID=1735272 RepID=UPI001B887B0C|nr:uncharacterized protein LOC121375919 [Gigantopelta aegis]